MKLELKSSEVLAMVVHRLAHLDECRDFINDIRKAKLHEVIIARQATEKYEHNRGVLEAALRSYDDMRREHALKTEMDPHRGFIVQFMEEVEELEKAEDIVERLGSTRYDYEMWSKANENFRSRLDRLTDFDDSE
jgi:hypothetical protein